MPNTTTTVIRIAKIPRLMDTAVLPSLEMPTQTRGFVFPSSQAGIRISQGQGYCDPHFLQILVTPTQGLEQFASQDLGGRWEDSSEAESYRPLISTSSESMLQLEAIRANYFNKTHRDPHLTQ